MKKYMYAVLAAVVGLVALPLVLAMAPDDDELYR